MAQATKTTSTGRLPEKSYISRLQDLLSRYSSSTASAQGSVDLVDLLRKQDTSKTKVFYTNSNLKPRIGTLSDIVALSADDLKNGREAFCVVENISPSCIEELGLAWNLDPEFFVGHVTNPDVEDLWGQHSVEYEVRKYRHLDGAFEYRGLKGQKDLHSLPNYFPRLCFEQPPHPIQSSTRISYYRVSQGLCKGNNIDIERRD